MKKSIVPHLLLPFLLSMISVFSIKGSNPNYYFRQISIEQGLSQNTVNSILVDYKGYLWIGTNSGLNSFNRNEISIYLHDRNNVSSLPGNKILFVAEDSLNNLWVSTNNGLVLYDRINKIFIPVSPKRTIQAYSYILLKEGILFSSDGYLYKYCYKSKRLKRIHIKGKPFGSNIYFSRMLLFNKKTLILTSNDSKVWLYNLQKKTMRMFFSCTNKIMASFVDKNGRFYLSYYKDGIRCFSPKGKELYHLTTANSGLTNNIILDIALHRGKIWLGTDGGGICIFDPADPKQITSLQHKSGDSGSLPNNSIKVLCADNKNNIWAGTVRGGMFGVQEVPIRTYRDVPLMNNKGLSEKVVISLFEDQDGMLWIGTDGGGINKYNPYTDQFHHYPTTYGDKIVSITDFSPDELLLSVYEKGLLIFNKKNGRYSPFTLINETINTKECFMEYVPFAYRISEDKICILSRKPYIYNSRQKTFSIIQSKDRSLYLGAMKLIYNSEKYFYLVGQYSLFEVEKSTNILRKIYTTSPLEIINAACSDGKGNFWIGTDSELSCYDSRKKKVHHIQTRLFANITTLLLDNQNRLWIGAQNMLFSYSTTKKNFVVLGESDGFTANELIFSPILSKHTGNIYMGGISGLVKINSKVPYKDESQPLIELSDLLIDGNTCLSKINQKDPYIKVPWNYNSLIAKIHTREADVFRNVLFRYSIPELNKKGVDSYNSTIDFSNLAPGEYTIMIACNTKSGKWTKPTKLLYIIVTPPWYKRSWAICMFILIVIGFSVSIGYSIIKKKENRLKWKMKEHEQKTYEDKIRFLINVSHEFRTSLTLIHAPLKRLLESFTNVSTPKEEYQHKVLASVYKQTKEMKTTIDMILDINQIGNVEERLQKKVHVLNDWIRSVVEDFRLELDSKEIELEYQLDKNLGQACFDENKCKIVLSNFLMNALKFSFQHSKIVVTTSIQNDYIRIAVTDQGLGLDNVDLSKLFTRFYQGEHDRNGNGIGLSYAKVLIDMHNGNVGAYNNAEKGATFYYELPLCMEMEEAHDEAPVLAIEEYPMPDVQDARPYPTDQYSIILIEDNIELLTFMRDDLKKFFKKVYTATDGKKGLELINEKYPDIIVSDVMMPQMDGYELCKRVKETLDISHIPIILLTARTDLNSTSIGYKLGADVYLPKPFEMDTLIHAIQNQLRSREKTRELLQKGLVSKQLIQKLTTNNVDEKFLRKLNATIDENLKDHHLDVDFLTKSMGISRTPLYKKVKVLTGLGVNDYINNYRVNKAEELLLNTEMSITEISDETGFSYQRYFSTMFKQLKGVTPSQFREKQNKKSETNDS